MIKAVLLDLDDTLLRIDTDAFVERYLRTLTQLILERYPALAESPVPVGKAIMRAVRDLITNLDPTRSNAEVFTDAISTMLEVPTEALFEVFAEFYKTGYAAMADAAAQIEAAQPLLERLTGLGLAVVIATNPLFPLEATQQRLDWAGLGSHTFSLITHIGEMHFAKPMPHYYEEILARVGVEADEAIMIGDNFENDILPALAAGINTFWIDLGKSLLADLSPESTPDGQGTLAEFEQLVTQEWLATLKPRAHTPEQVVPRMLGNIGALFGLISSIKPEYWNMRPDPQEWSPLETICHLRDSERMIQRPRLQRIAREDNPFISDTKPPPGPGERNLSREDGNMALRELWDERCQTINFIQGLQPDDWKRPARHSIFGPTTLLEMAHFSTRHDHLHINQLCETIGRCRKTV